MANMSYYRFENTYMDLLDYFDEIRNEAGNDRDERYRIRLIELLKETADLIENLNEELAQ